MAESILEWMKKNERRFNSQPISKRGHNIKHLHTLATNELRPRSQTPQKTMDSFFTQSSENSLFDESFSKEDFNLFTKRWKEQNLENVAVN